MQQSCISSRTQTWKEEVRRQEDRRGGAALQRWRWLYVVLIGAAVAVLSIVVNLGIAGLNHVKIKTTERLISGPGVPAASLCCELLLQQALNHVSAVAMRQCTCPHWYLSRQ